MIACKLARPTTRYMLRVSLAKIALEVVAEMRACMRRRLHEKRAMTNVSIVFDAVSKAQSNTCNVAWLIKLHIKI
jgi:hypothetical protein